MSKPAPRKARHTRNPSNRIPAVSDYESDAMAVSAAAASYQSHSYEPPPLRSNTELNLSVLQRYQPSVRAILSIAANAVIYAIDSVTGGWVKSGIEGTMFVCAQAPLPDDPEQRPRACVFVLNRRGLDNVVIDLARVSHAEDGGELIFLMVEGGRGKEEQEKVLGLWIHNEKEDTRERNWAMIEESWKVARTAGAFEGQYQDVGPAAVATGRRLSLSDLFNKQSANTAH